ncbi:FadR/GntR family transcriptional regulator [Thalassotalea fonticola]|uniref:FadR/GntR family transcriptional regulator n=1 Tax=Thalassotalea fonticola TaxID=3065649 RepID=A0ABZ0GKH4_9GAMM|nr:FadR/GntR family transcriptional regulator [Colwelliaceae bacterium S1-1]
MTEMQFAVGQLQNSRSLTNELVESLREQIVGGKMQPGTKLPAAKVIEEQAGVSRSVVREAIAALKAEGLIISRQGVGVFVANSTPKKTFEIEEEEFNSVDDAIKILELRIAVEVEMSVMAASNRSVKQMKTIWKCLDNFDKQIEAGNDAVKEDFLFHLAIADASGNPYFSRFIEYIGSGVIPSREIITNNERSYEPSNYLALIQQEHRNIAQAIEDKDIEAARLATREHLGNSRERHIKIAKRFKKNKK